MVISGSFNKKRFSIDVQGETMHQGEAGKLMMSEDGFQEFIFIEGMAKFILQFFSIIKNCILHFQ